MYSQSKKQFTPLYLPEDQETKHHVCPLENQDDNWSQTEANVCATLWLSFHLRQRGFRLG
jgi:hypothetical protein